MVTVHKGAGDWLREKRKAASIGLRQFAILIGESPSNWCNVENGRRPPPQSEDKLRRIAQVLGIRSNGDDWDYLFGIVKRPPRAAADIERYAQIEHVPTLLRTIGERKLSGEEILRVIKYVERYFGKGKKDAMEG